MVHSRDATHVGIWAPHASRLELVSHGRVFELSRDTSGWFEADIPELSDGDRYLFRIGGESDTPDPASLSQPDGVHAASAVTNLDRVWAATGWRNRPLRDHVFYELHVGTFTPEGTFAGVMDRIPHLLDLGVSAIELMPVAQFPGRRNWGYDGVDLYAVQHSYGGARGLQELVDACHEAEIAVFLDVVYNHLGPEGNYLGRYGPYFTDRYQTPWGQAINLDGPGSDQVRSFLIENALMWVDDFRLDGLRLDAIHALYDHSARPFLLELSEAVGRVAERQDRRIQLVVENAANDPRVLQPAHRGGSGMDAAWNDDFHHALHVALTGETTRYYADFTDPVPDLATALTEGYANAGRHSSYRQRRHGAPSGHLPRSAFVVFAQNHDQVGNRAFGDRLSILVDHDRLRFAAAITLLAPSVPMLFMGEEWAETRPFLYFVDHGDPDLNQAVRRGRAEEFAGFYGGDGDVPDPASPEVFERSKLDWDSRNGTRHRHALELHRRLIRLRAAHPAITDPASAAHSARVDGSLLTLESSTPEERIVIVFNASADPAKTLLPDRDWRLLLDGADDRFGGPGSGCPLSVEGAGVVPLGPWGFAAYVEVGR